MKPIIGIVGRTNKIEYDKYKIYVNDDHRRAIIESGGIPISILPTQNIEYEKIDNGKTNMPLSEEEKEDLISEINLCNGIVLQGGYYSFYYDEFVAKYCLENDIPILGTCLGMQVLACVDCNTSRKENIKLIESKINHWDYETNYVHKIVIDKNSKLFNIIKCSDITVNSRHKYSIILTNKAQISARAEDNIVEAIEFSNKKFAIGVQWHPENMYQTDDNMKKLFKAFIESTKNSSRNFKII